MSILSATTQYAALAACVVVSVMIMTAACDGDKGDNMATEATRAVPNEILDWKVSDTVETYDRESIFDYINGAGEVYRSYAFRDVTVWRFSKPDAPDITVEIFDMDSPEDAYGVFSYTRESEESGIGGGYEQRGSVLCFWQNRYYVCVAAYESTDDTRQAVTMLARSIAQQLPPSGRIPRLIGLLPQEGMIEHTQRFFHIHASLNYHYFLAEQNILKLSESTNAVLGVYEPGTTYLLCVEYPTAQEAREAYSSFVENYLPEAAETGVAMVDVDKWVCASKRGRYVVITFDAASRDRSTMLTDAMKRSLADANLVTQEDQ